MQTNQQPVDSSVGPTTRTEALSDGVFAIALTVLVLNLRAPSHRDGALLAALVAQWPAYVSFLASFLFIGVISTNLHAAFAVRSVDHGVTSASLAILCGTVLFPFPTAVLADTFRAGSRGDRQTAAILYAGLAVLIQWHGLPCSLLRRRSSPYRATAVSRHGARGMRQPILGSLRYAGGALLGLVLAPAVSLAILVAIPLYSRSPAKACATRRPNRRSRRCADDTSPDAPGSERATAPVRDSVFVNNNPNSAA